MRKSQTTRLKALDVDKLNELIVSSIQDKKGKSIVAMDLRKIDDSVTDIFVICQADSNTQVKAIADFVTDNVKAITDESPWHKEGYENLEWVLLDYVNIVVHVFHYKTREFYQLEDLWSDAKLTRYEDID